MKIPNISTENASNYLLPSIMVGATSYLAHHLYKKYFPPAAPLQQGPAKAELPIKNPLAVIKSKEQQWIRSDLKYLGAAIVVAGIAAAVFAPCPPLGISLTLVSGWLFFSSVFKFLSAYAKKSDGLATKIMRHLDSFASDINTAVTLAAITALSAYKTFHLPIGYPNGRPILMINGYLGSSSNWFYQRSQLADAGFGPIYTANIGSFESIETYARQVQDQVRKIKQETGRDDLILICHSKGGLVGSYYATHFAQEDNMRVTDLIAIGSPFAGTPVANLGVGKDAEEMRPGHPFNCNLREEIAKHPEIRFFCIGSETDLIVPAQSALSGTNRQSHKKVFKNIGHSQLLFSEKTTNQICKWLNQSVLQTISDSLFT